MMKKANTYAMISFLISVATSICGRHIDTLKLCHAYVLNVSIYSSRRRSIDLVKVPLGKHWNSLDSITHYTATRILSSSSSAGADQQSEVSKTLESRWDIPGLRKEVGRLILRTHKKIGKASERLRKTRGKLLGDSEENETTSLDLEDGSDANAIQTELEELRERLVRLNQLESLLSSQKQKSMVLPEEIARLALALNVNDAPPPRPVREPPQPKGPRVSGPRLPYRRFYSHDKTEIRVGKTAVDNDEVSTAAEHRNDWWMHASGCPGSHVIIRTGGSMPSDEVVQDAAALAARHSKCSGCVIKVSLTRCRDVKKPPGAKPGLVFLTGSVQTISVNMKAAEQRLERLDQTELIN